MSDYKIDQKMYKPFLGKNVFFIHSNDCIHSEIVMPILRAEYQVYEIDTEDDIIKAVTKYPDSVLLFYLANTKPEFSLNVHAKMIEKVFSLSDRRSLRVGIICDTDSALLRRSALYTFNINGAFVPLSKSYNTGVQNIIKSLELTGAKGIRKYVRAECQEEDNANVSFNFRNKKYTGRVTDVSSIGFAVEFEDDPDLPPDIQLHDTILSIRDVDIISPCRVFGVRQSELNTSRPKEYVMLFEERINEEKIEIYDYIYYCLRREFNK